MTATTPIWGKLADLFSKKLLVQTRAGHLLDRLADRRLRAHHGGADRRPRHPGPRRRRPDRAGPGRHRHDGLARASAAATPATSARPSRWPRSAARSSAACSSTPVGWRWCFFVGLPVAAARLRRAPEDPAPAGRSSARSTSTTSAPRCSSAASRCCWSGSRSPATSSPGAPPPASPLVVAGLVVIAAAVYVEAYVAEDPIIPLRLFRDRTTALATARLGADRRRDVRRDRLPLPVLPARPRHVARPRPA